LEDDLRLDSTEALHDARNKDAAPGHNLNIGIYFFQKIMKGIQ